jgi:hypothetical protein
VTESTARIVQLNLTPEALGLVIDFVGRRPPFSHFETGTLLEALGHQLRDQHHLVAFDGLKVVGYAGWMMTTTQIAEAWQRNEGGLVRRKGEDADAAVLTIVASIDKSITKRLMRGARELNPGRRAYFKRDANDTSRLRKISVRV